MEPIALAPVAAAGQTAPASQERIDPWRGSKLVGIDVLGPDGGKIGAVSGVLMNHDGRAVDVVIGVGGFPGIGQKGVSLPFAEVHFTDAARAIGSAAGAPNSAASMPIEPGMSAGSAVSVETPAAAPG